MSETATHAASRRAWEPLALLLVALLPTRSLLEPTLPLGDPGIGWHLVQGRLILESGTLPLRDDFSFTAPGAEWPSYYWLFELMAAALERLGGLPLFVAAVTLAHAAIPLLLFQRMLRMGVGSLLAALFATLAQLALLGHAYARPHAATYLLFALLVDRIDRFDSGGAPARSLWCLPLLAGVWCNLHAGFVVSLAVVGLYAGAAGTKFLTKGDPLDRSRALAFAGCALAMGVATLANPAGPYLHLSILDYLRMESTPHFAENAGFAFGPNLRSWSVEIVIAGFLLLLAARARLAWAEAALLGFLLYASMSVSRHVSLFVIAAVPLLGRETANAIERTFPTLGPAVRRRLSSSHRLGSRWVFAGLAGAFLALAASGSLPYPNNLDGVHLSGEAAAFIDAHPDRFARPFNTDSLGGSLIYRFWPRLRVFVDDRTPVYGDRFIMDEYLRVLRAEVGWEAVLERWGIEEALVRSDEVLARLLDASPAWRAVHRDELTTIFFRVEGAAAPDPRSGPSRR